MVLDLFKHLIIAWSIIGHGVLTTSAFAQEITSHTLSEGNFACTNQVIVITCLSIGPSGIQWASDDYIPPVGNPIAFVTGVHHVGDSLMSTSNIIYANLTRKEVHDGVQLLESKLRINIPAFSTSRNSTVKCLNYDTGIAIDAGILDFQVIVDPYMPSAMNANQIMNKMGDCMLHMAWSAPINVEPRHVHHYMIHLNGENVKNVSSAANQQQNLLSHHICTCDSHNVSIQAVSMCGRIGESTQNATTVPMNLAQQSCGIEDNLVTSPGRPTVESAPLNIAKSGATDCSCDISIYKAWGIIATTLFFVLMVATIIAVAVLCVQLKKEVKNKEDKDTPRNRSLS